MSVLSLRIRKRIRMMMRKRRRKAGGREEMKEEEEQRKLFANLAMILHLPRADTEHRGGVRVARKMIAGEADSVGADTLGDVLGHVVQLGHSRDTVILVVKYTHIVMNII